MNRRRQHPVLLTTLILACTGTAAIAEPVVPSVRAAISAPKYVLLVPGVAPEPISLLSIGLDGSVKQPMLTYLDNAGARKSRPLSEVIALAPANWSPTPENTAESGPRRTSGPSIHRLDLTDGQRLLGELIDPPAAGDASQSVHVRHERLGAFAFPIDRVRRYEDDAQVAILPTRPFSSSSDTVLLMNGDVIEGFVASLGTKVVIEPTAAPGGKRTPATKVAIDQVAVVQLSNPPAQPTGARLDLSDGTTLSVSDITARLETGKCIFRPLLASKDQDLVGVELAELGSIVPDASRLIPLSSLPIASQQAAIARPAQTQARMLEYAPAPLGASDILLPTPMTIDWALPEKATSISGYAQMDDRSFVWGDCVVTVLIVDRTGKVRQELASARVNASSPTLSINAALTAKPGDRLRVAIDPGERGPVQDRIVLRRMLLVRETGG